MRASWHKRLYKTTKWVIPALLQLLWTPGRSLYYCHAMLCSTPSILVHKPTLVYYYSTCRYSFQWSPKWSILYAIFLPSAIPICSFYGLSLHLTWLLSWWWRPCVCVFVRVLYSVCVIIWKALIPILLQVYTHFCTLGLANFSNDSVYVFIVRETFRSYLSSFYSRTEKTVASSLLPALATVIHKIN